MEPKFKTVEVIVNVEEKLNETPLYVIDYSHKPWKLKYDEIIIDSEGEIYYRFYYTPYGGDEYNTIVVEAKDIIKFLNAELEDCSGLKIFKDYAEAQKYCDKLEEEKREKDKLIKEQCEKRDYERLKKLYGGDK